VGYPTPVKIGSAVRGQRNLLVPLAATYRKQPEILGQQVNQSRRQPRLLKPAVALLVAFAAGLTVVACGNSQPAGSNAKTTPTAMTTPTTTSPPIGRVDANNNSFSVGLPGNWLANFSDAKFVLRFFAPGSSPADKYNATTFDVSMDSKKDPLPATVKEAAETIIFCRDMNTAAPRTVESTTIDGEPAFGCDYKMGDMPGRYTVVRHGDNQYSINFNGRTAFDAAKADYEAILKSWKWSR
jgi:hypothetical protein